MSKGTELGLIRHEDAMRGLTCGVPALKRDDVELVKPSDDSWICARLPVATMLELIRTPGYQAYQDENWLFCCGGPMVYLGLWSGERLWRLGPEQVVDPPVDQWLKKPHPYELCVFRCRTCKKHRAYWDVS
jgi:uncharacterized protein CbrC (UPF0167 family)